MPYSPMTNLAPTNPCPCPVSIPSEPSELQSPRRHPTWEETQMNEQIRSTVVSAIALFGYAMLVGLLWVSQ